MGGSTETRGAARQARRPGGRSPGRPPPAERHPPSAQQLRALIDQADYTTAAVLLDGFDLDTESDPQVLYCAGICLGSLDRPDDAVKLLRRARAGGFAAFWCAYHLGLFEMKAGRAAQACFYLTVSLILDPARDDLVPLLSRLAPDLDLSLLRVAQRGNRSAAAAQTAVDLGRGVLDTGNPAAAASYFAVALILNPDNEAARALLLELAPDVTFEVMPPPPGEAPTPGRLRDLVNGGRLDEGAALLKGVDLAAERNADFLYYAAICLASISREREAVDLLKRAAAAGFAGFWCAYHLGLFEEKLGRTAHAAYYYSAALILDPARADIFALLDRVAPELDLTALHAAQRRVISTAEAGHAFDRGMATVAAGRFAEATSYFTAALALDPGRADARQRISVLAPDVLLGLITEIDADGLALSVRGRLNEPVLDAFDFDRRLELAESCYRPLLEGGRGRSIIPPIESLFLRGLTMPGMPLEPLCRLYDILYDLYWNTSPRTEDLRRFSDRVAAPFAAAIRNGLGAAELPPVPRRQLGREPLRVGYLAHYAALGPGNAIGPFARHIVGGLSQCFPDRYRLSLYAWMYYNDATFAPFDGTSVRIRKFDARSMTERIAAVAGAIAEDQIDVLITDMNSSLPTVLFERRVAPVQIFWQHGQPFWPLTHVDAVFRNDLAFDNFAAEKNFVFGIGPWDLAALAPPVDPARVASERARFPAGLRLIGNYGRLIKITPEFLAIVEQILAQCPEVMVILGGTGDSSHIRRFIAERGLAERLTLVEGYVDGHLWGHIIEVFLDTFPAWGGIAGREVMAKGVPLVTMRVDPPHDNERVGMLIAADAEDYAGLVSRLMRDPGFYARACAETREFAESGTRTEDYAAAIDKALSAVVAQRRGSLRAGRAGAGSGALALDRLVYAPVLDEIRPAMPSRIHEIRFGPDDRAIEIGAVERVAYFPSLYLQVYDGRIVPQEANPDPYGPTYLRDHIQMAAAGRLGTRTDGALQECDDEVCILGNFLSYAFFHIFEELYKVTALERYGFSGKYVLADARGEGVPGFVIEFLQLLGVGKERILRCAEPTVFRSAMYTSPLKPEDILNYPGMFFALRNRLRGAVDADCPGLGPRLWIERRQSRVLVNRAEIHECLERHGFTIADMASLPLGRQIAAAMRTSILAGPHGAGMMHAAFMPENSTVIECFSPDYLNPSVLEVCRLLRHRYSQLVPINTPSSPYPHGMNIEVSRLHLELTLQDLA